MAAMLVASSTAVAVRASEGVSRDVGLCSSSSARPHLLHARKGKQRVSGVIGKAVSSALVRVQSRGAAFPVARSTMTENPTPVTSPPLLCS